MRDLKRLYLIATIFICAACNPNEPDTVADTAERTEMTGQQAYDTYCAACHDTGADGAPVTGNPDDWSDRSWLWQSVLFAHANDGYLDMPPKGGATELTEIEINLAAEYMLQITHSNIPRD